MRAMLSGSNKSQKDKARVKTERMNLVHESFKHFSTY